jgi:YD repeat-containing protein
METFLIILGLFFLIGLIYFIIYKSNESVLYNEKYDANGNRIPTGRKDSSFGCYDSKGNLIHFRCKDGNEWWYEYDADGNRIHTEYKDGTEIWYSDNGHKIHGRTKTGVEWWAEYDYNGNLIHYTDKDGTAIWYDSNGHEIHT